MRGFTVTNRFPDVTTAVGFSSLEPFATSHFWDFGDNSTSTQANPTKVYATPGTYDVYYRASNSLGTREYKERRTVTVVPSRSRTPHMTLDVGALPWSTDLAAVPAGSLIKLKGTRVGDRRYFRNATGIHFINEGQINWTLDTTAFSRDEAILFENCKDVIFDMKADPTIEYGMKINNAGFNVQTTSSKFKVYGCFLENVASSGFKFKDSNLMRVDHPNIFEDCHIAGNKVKGGKNEGMYIGHYAYEQYRHTVRRCKIYRNIVEDMGWDGIQPANGDEDCEVHDNIVRGCGASKTANQLFGLSINSGFTGEVYNNLVIEKNGCGGRIQVHPHSHVKLYNNVFWGPLSNTSCIFIRVIGNDDEGAFQHTKPGLHFYIFNNTTTAREQFVRTTQFLLTGQEELVRLQSLQLLNNLIQVPSGVTVQETYHTNFAPLSETKNQNVRAVDLGLTDPANENFYPLPGSPALNAGAWWAMGAPTTYMGDYDIDGLKRVNRKLGAYEYALRLAKEPEPQPEPPAPPPPPPPNVPPQVSITSPLNTAVFTEGNSVTITASATDSDGTIAKVEFFVGQSLLGTKTTAPYAVVWSNVPAGTHSLTAKATDNSGGSTTSTPVGIQVNVPDTPPVVSLTSPLNGSVYESPATINFAATATDDVGIALVEFYRDGIKVGEKASAPHTLSLSPVYPGTYTLTAVATDSVGAKTTSSAVSVTVIEPEPPSLPTTDDKPIRRTKKTKLLL
jgi:PKD repeat protein